VDAVRVTCDSFAPNAGYGNRRALVVHLKFSDEVGEPFPIAATEARLAAVAAFFREISYGASTLTYDIKSWASLPNTRAYYQQQPTGSSLTTAAVEHVRLTHDLAQFDIVAILLTPLELGYPGCFEVRYTYNGRVIPTVILSGQGGAGVSCNQNASIMSHEFGHAYGPADEGFLHSSMFACKTWPDHMPSTFTDPTYSETDCGIRAGDPNATFFPYSYYDFLGGYRGHPNTYWKLQAGWIAANQVFRVRNEDVVTVEPIEVDSVGTKVAQVMLGGDQAGRAVSYWVEYRSQRPRELEANPPGGGIPQGEPDKVKVWINLPGVPPEAVQGGKSSVEQSRVFTFWDFANGPAPTDLAVGQVFADPYRGVKIERLANATSDAHAAATVRITRSALQVSPALGAIMKAGQTRRFILTNNGSRSLALGKPSVKGREPAAFQVVADACGGTAIAPAGACTIDVLHSRPSGDTRTVFASIEWTSDDDVRKTPSVGLIGVP
jgi:hypothetical protein